MSLNRLVTSQRLQERNQWEMSYFLRRDFAFFVPSFWSVQRGIDAVRLGKARQASLHLVHATIPERNNAVHIGDR